MYDAEPIGGKYPNKKISSVLEISLHPSMDNAHFLLITPMVVVVDGFVSEADTLTSCYVNV